MHGRIAADDSNACAHARGIAVVCRDSSVHDAEYDGAFDAVLADAPCSGYGVIGENPDIKFFRKEESLAELTKTQRAILDACAPYVKAGGALYYSTCSLFAEENDGTAGAFLEGHPQFAVQELSCPLAHRRTKYGLQFLPHISMGAGFYVCKFQKVDS